MKILVTGGTGFIGSHLVDYLINKDDRNEVIVTDNLSGGKLRNLNPKAEFFEMDVRDKNALESVMKDVEIVYHTAAYAAEIMSLFRPVFVTEVNVLGSMNVIKAAINSGVKKFVFVSSNSVYGKQKILPYTEDMVCKPDDIYAIGKLAIERSLNVMQELYGMDYTIIRPHNVMGPRQNISDPYRNVLGIWFNRIMRNRQPMVYGDGYQKRSFTYITDLVEPIAECAFLGQAQNETFNIGSDEIITLNEAAKEICKVMDFEAGFMRTKGRPQEVKFAYPSHEKAKRLLNYEAKVPFKEGIKLMADWVKTQPVQQFVFFDRLEIEKKVPKVWKEKLL